MSIKFIIEKLGPIRNSEIEFSPFMIFSGASGLGKSYTSLLVYYLFDILGNEITKEDFKRVLEKKHLKDFKSNADLSENTNYEINNIIDILQDYFSLTINKFFSYILGYRNFDCAVKLNITKPLLFNVRKKSSVAFEIECASLNRLSIYVSKDDSTNELWWDGFFNFIITCLYKHLFISQRNHFILPPSRGGFIDFPSSVYEKLTSGLFKEFVSQIDELKSPTREQQISNSLLDNILQDIFKGQILVNKGQISYKFKETEIPITAAASSIKELSPLFMILQKFQANKIFVLFEEPEVHLHPEIQRKVARLISYIVNNNGFITVTTHSSYFINQINNLIKLHFVKEKLEKSEFDELLNQIKIDENLILNPEIIGSYFFELQSDSTVKIIKQSIDYAMPVSAFKPLVDEMMSETDSINDKLYF